MSNIVNMNVSQVVAPTPATLQKCGALISQGATNTAQYTLSLLTQLSDLTPLLAGSVSATAATWANSGGGIATITSASLPAGLDVGDEFEVTLTGFVPAAWNGTYIATVASTTTFTVPIYSNPGSATVLGAWTLEDVAELTAMANTHFAQGSTQAVFVLELGAGSVNDGVAALATYLTENTNTAYRAGATGYNYAYQVPRAWDGNANFLALILQYSGLQAKTYFYVTTTLATYQRYTPLMKAAKLFIEAPAIGVWKANVLTAVAWASDTTYGGKVTATTTTAHGVAVGQWFQISGVTPTGYNGWAQALPGTTGSTLVWALATNPGTETVLGTLVKSSYASSAPPATEFSAASDFWVNLNRTPSVTNKVTPNRFAFVYGVTPFPTKGMSALRKTLEDANINFIDTGAEGGISTTMVSPGVTADGRDFTYWYSVDWMQINGDLDLANEVINGSNNPLNPLYYNQAGIDRLQGRLAKTTGSGVTFGMVLGHIVQTQFTGDELAAALESGDYDGIAVVNAVPFLDYSKAHPGHYKIGEYDGLSVSFVPSRGFAHITVNLVVSDFVSS